MTTTRETADHAELLVRLANDMRKFEHHAVGSLRIDMDEVRKIIAACDGHSELLSEIAALRSSVSLADRAAAAMADRATQAERQRDEVVGLLRVADTAMANITAFDDEIWSAIGSTNLSILKANRTAIRAFIAKQGADQ